MAMNPRLLRPTASGFDPRRIANLGLWLDAADASSLTLNGSTVSEWRDKSGNARNFAQATAGSQPNAGTRTQNGLRVLDFQGAQRLVGNSAAASMARNVGGATLIVVAAFDVTSDTRNLMLISRGDNSQLPRIRLLSASSLITASGRRLDTDSNAGVQYAANTNPNILLAVFDYANSDIFLFQNGLQQASSLTWLTAGSTSDTDSLGVSLGADPNGNGPLDGFVAEIVYYQRVLSAAERQAVNRYLGAKWGITVA